jgi:protein phosphatase
LVAGESALPSAQGLVELLDGALWEANRTLLRIAAEEPDCAGMGATAVAGLVFDKTVAICHVGDCRAYHHTSGTLRRVTRDQTLAQRLVDLGTLTEEEASQHPSASQVAQALGRHYDLEPSRQTLELAGGDWLVLSCDGLHAHLDESAIGGVIERARQPSELAQTLIEGVNAAGGSDNCTVIAVRVVG